MPYRVLNFLTSYINYGGRVTDYIDLRTIDVLMRTFYTPRVSFNLNLHTRQSYCCERTVHCCVALSTATDQGPKKTLTSDATYVYPFRAALSRLQYTFRLLHNPSSNYRPEDTHRVFVFFWSIEKSPPNGVSVAFFVDTNRHQKSRCHEYLAQQLLASYQQQQLRVRVRVSLQAQSTRATIEVHQPSSFFLRFHNLVA